MPYVSPFMTLAEAIDWISKQDKCSRREAKHQLIAALADIAGNRTTGWCWEDQRSGMTAVMDSRPDRPWLDREYWQGNASIRRGRVFDRWTNRWRVLLIPKQSIFQHWPESSVASAASEIGKAEPTTKAKRRGRPNAQIEIHQAVDRLVQRGYDVKGMLRKQLVALVEEECGKRRKPRTIKTYISSWLEKHRTGA